jgi:hypothetical protein
MNKQRVMRVLAQRSTIVGIVGVLAAVMALLEIPISAEQELRFVEGVLLLVSVIAIATKEEEPYDGTNRRASAGAVGRNICSDSSDTKEQQEQGASE